MLSRSIIQLNVLLILSAALISGCSTIAKLNFKFGIGVDPIVKSEYSTLLSQGDLEVDYLYGAELGVGYYGLIDGVNLGLEANRRRGRSQSLKDGINVISRYLVADYFFNKSEPQGPFVGVGIGSIGESFAEESVNDYSAAWQIRGGWMMPIFQQGTLYFSAYYQQANTNRVGRFFYFAPEADVEFKSLGLETGIYLNLFP